MTTLYQCDITGNVYKHEHKLEEVALSDTRGPFDNFEYGPDATLEGIREELRQMVEEWEPYHDEWWDEQSRTCNPPRIVEKEIVGESTTIRIPTVKKFN